MECLAEPYPYHVLQPLQRPLRHSWGPQKGNILGKISLLAAPGVLQTFHTTQMESQQAKCPPSINYLLYGMQGGRGWLAFGDRSRIPQSFRRARICKLSRQKRRFLQLRENRPFVVVKRLTHRHVPSNTLY